MQYEWKVTEHWFTQGYGAAQREIDEMASDGFNFYHTLVDDDRKCHYNIFRKKINNKKLWLDFDITPNLSVKDKEGNVFTIIQLRNQLAEMKGWILLSPTNGVAYKPCDSYFSTWDIVKYLNENGFELNDVS